MTIRIKIFESKSINESELKYSQKSLDLVLSTFKDLVPNIANAQEWGFGPIPAKRINLPIKDFLYSENPKIMSGAVALITKNIYKKNIGSLKKEWNVQKKQFNHKFIKAMIEKSFVPIYLHINDDDQSGGSLVCGENKIRLFLSINGNSIEQISRHELQHMTQVLNSLALTYYTDLDANSEDITKISFHDYKEENTFGLGNKQERTYTKQPENDLKKGASKTQKTAWYKQYFSDDEEYETLLSDILTDITQIISIENYKIIGGLNALEKAEVKEQFRKQPNKKYIIASKFAKQQQVSLSDFLREINDSKSYSDLATQFIKTLYTSKEVFKLLPKAGQLLFKNIKGIRTKEFAKDLLNNLVLKLKKIKTR